MAIINTLKITIEGKEYTVTGGKFYDMLNAVKEIDGRKYDGDHKRWILPIPLEPLEQYLEEFGYRIIAGEEDLINAEFEEIKRIRELLEAYRERAEQVREGLDESRKTYSFRSTSRKAASIATDAACLRNALNSLKKPIESLAEIEIRGMKRACEILELI
jgi:hypothetical protein